jgi:L-alanine-DL-glutamate epimerase-like enolase superfamily enzyme
VDSLLVRVTTDDGLEGWGEAFGFRAVDSAKLAIETLIAPIFIGQDATRIRPLVLEVQKKLHIFGRGGVFAYGMSAVEIALWDIAGKAAKAPVCRLLGGGVADIACYGSLVRYSNPSLVRANVRQAIEAGFHMLKLHEIALSAIRGARDEAGPDVALTLDVNCPWTLTEARAGRGTQGGRPEVAGGAALAAREFHRSGRAEKCLRNPDRGRRERVHADGVQAPTRREGGGFCSTEPGQDGRHQRAV